MEFKRCSICKNWYDKKGHLRVCNSCDEKIFPQIKKFLEENKDSDARDIAKALNISEKVVLDYLADDRLQIVKNPGITANKCSSCGKEFFGEGDFCRNCLEKKLAMAKMLKELTDSYKEEGKVQEKPKSEHKGMKYFK